MAETNAVRSVSISQLTLVPGLISLGITVLRLVGELQHWPKLFFNPAPGGGGGLVAIVWLVPVFGIYFALKLARSGFGPGSVGKSIGFALLGLLVAAGGAFLGIKAQFRDPLLFISGLLLFVVAIAIQFFAWPALAKALLAYGYAARIPVLVIMYFALAGNWGTHYDGLPPNFPEMAFWHKFLDVAIFPQMIFWVMFTVVIGALFGGVAIAIAGRAKAPAQATS